MVHFLGVTANITGGPRGTIRTAQATPSVTNISTGFVRGPPRTPSPAGTVIPTATTWMTATQPVQLIRANIGQSPRAKCKFVLNHTQFEQFERFANGKKYIYFK